MELTLCLIVKNEEKNLPTCLSSFRDLFTKLVIIDTGSTDNTVSIAQNFGAEIHNYHWKYDFSDARNYALSKVKTPWVMIVDADDTIEKQTLINLKNSLENIPENINGIFLPYLYAIVENNNGIMAYLPRIWKINKRYKYTLPIHEYLDIPIEDLITFIKLDHPIIHNKDNHSIHNSFNRNLEILKITHEKNPDQRRIIFYLGHDNQYAGNYQDAINWYTKYTSLKQPNKDELTKAFIGIGICQNKLRNFTEAKNSFLKAIETNADFIEPYLYLGEIAMNEKNYDVAALYYFQALTCQLPKTHVFVNTHLYKGFAQKKLEHVLQTLEKVH